MSQERKSIRNFIEALIIFANYMKEGENTAYFLDAEHDELFIHVSKDELDLESTDGKRLLDLGFHISSETELWTYFT